jgi:hypothetical protein
MFIRIPALQVIVEYTLEYANLVCTCVKRCGTRKACHCSLAIENQNQGGDLKWTPELILYRIMIWNGRIRLLRCSEFWKTLLGIGARAAASGITSWVKTDNGPLLRNP